MSDERIVNGVHLQQVEASSRAYVRQHPDDMEARLELAWCLLVQALYQAGREAPVLAIPPHDTAADTSWFAEAVVERDVFAVVNPDTSPARRAALRPDTGPCHSNDMFRECLHQAITVQQLSTHAEDHLSAKHLQSLIYLSGGERVVAMAQHRLLNCTLSMFRDLDQQAQDSP